MDTELAQMIGNMQASLGRIEQKIDSHKEAFTQHIQDDHLAYKAISSLRETVGDLQVAVAKQKGFITGVGAAASAVGAAVAWLIERMWGGHS